MKNYFYTLVCFTLIVACGSTKKAPLDAKAIADFTSFVNEKSFEFVGNTAHPTNTQSFNAVANSGILPPGNNSGAIQLIGIPNFVKVYGDSVAGYLPFYGERYLGGGPNSNTGIEFKGIPEYYEQNFNTEKERFEIEFEIAEKTEVYQINILLFPNNSANVSVNTTQRTSIRFNGFVKALENESE